MRSAHPIDPSGSLDRAAAAIGGGGRRHRSILAAVAFVLVGAAAVTGTPWLLVAGFVGHGLKDLWQHRTHFVANTRWWPPFCMAVDWVVAAIIVVEIAAGMHFGRIRCSARAQFATPTALGGAEVVIDAYEARRLKSPTAPVPGAGTCPAASAASGFA